MRRASTPSSLCAPLQRMVSEVASSNGSIGVLICDDDDTVRTLLRLVVQEAGDLEGRRGFYVVGEARDGEEVLSEAKRLQPDVVLLDLSIPLRTGFEALPEIKEVAPDAGVIVFSGFAASMMASDVLSRGADRYLEKGARPIEITAAIEEVAALRQQPRS